MVTDDSGTQGSGGNQLEISFNEDRVSVSGNTDRSRATPVVYTRGMTETLDAFAGYRYIRIRTSAPGGDTSGGGNLSVGAKWRFYENEESKTRFAVKPEILFPVGAGREGAGLGTGKTSGNLTLILTQEVPFGAIHVNAGVGRDRYRDTSINPDTTTTRASIAPVWCVAEQWTLALDIGTESSYARIARVRSNFAELGTVYSPHKELDFALGMLGSSDNQRPRTATQTVTAGIIWRFK